MPSMEALGVLLSLSEWDNSEEMERLLECAFLVLQVHYLIDQRDSSPLHAATCVSSGSKGVDSGQTSLCPLAFRLL